jgi:sulfide:quinone oxidoreductase
VARKAVVILGAGVGGLVAANLLRDSLRDHADITLIEKEKVFEFQPSYPWVMLGQRRPGHVQRPVSALRELDRGMLGEDSPPGVPRPP